MANAWYLPFDGVNDYVDIPTLSVLGTDDFAVEFRFPADTNTNFHRPIGGEGTNINSRVLIFDSGTWRLTSAANVNRNWSIPTLMTDDVIVRWQRVSGQLDLLIDGVVQSGGFSSNTDAYDFARIGSNTGSSTPTIASKCYYVNFEVNGSLVRQYKNNIDATQTVLPELVSGQDGTLIGFASPPPWTLYDDGGGGTITVDASTANYSYSPISATIDLTGVIEVTGATSSYAYNAITATVDLTAEIQVTGQTSNYLYSPIAASVDLTGEIVVTGNTANYSYTAQNGVVELGAVINIVGATSNYSYTAVDAIVSLVGEIAITAGTATYSYNGIRGVVQIGEESFKINFNGYIKKLEFSGIIKQSAFFGNRK